MMARTCLPSARWRCVPLRTCICGEPQHQMCPSGCLPPLPHPRSPTASCFCHSPVRTQSCKLSLRGLYSECTAISMAASASGAAAAAAELPNSSPAAAACTCVCRTRVGEHRMWSSWKHSTIMCTSIHVVQPCHFSMWMMSLLPCTITSGHTRYGICMHAQHPSRKPGRAVGGTNRWACHGQDSRERTLAANKSCAMQLPEACTRTRTHVFHPQFKGLQVLNESRSVAGKPPWPTP